MARLMGVETLLMLLTGLFSATVVPGLLGFPPAWPLFLVGFLMAMSFVALYALANLAGKRLGWSPRLLIGLLSYVAVFFGPLLLTVSLLGAGTGLPMRTAYTHLAGPAFGLVLVGAATAAADPGKRLQQAAGALFAYGLPMVGVRFVLVSLVGINPFAQLIAVQSGAFYLVLRGLVRVFAPTSAEGNLAAGPLIQRPVPDRVVGLVEGISRRTARPYATAGDGSLDRNAISILCQPYELTELTSRVQQALADQPFTVAAGERVDGQVELVVRPSKAGAGA